MAYTKEMYQKLSSKTVEEIQNCDIGELKSAIGITNVGDSEVRNFVASLVRIAHSAGSWEKFEEAMTAYENEEPVKLSSQDLDALKGGASLLRSSRSTFGWNPSC